MVSSRIGLNRQGKVHKNTGRTPTHGRHSAAQRTLRTGRRRLAHRLTRRFMGKRASLQHMGGSIYISR